MLIHLVPRLYNKAANVQVELLDVTIPELGLVLRGGKDIVARRPYPNKRFLVACRKVGSKAMTGLLIEAPARLGRYTSIIRWALEAELVIKHEVEHVVIDNDFEAVSEEMVFWYGYRGFANRWPDDLYPNSAPVHVQPRMDLFDPEKWGGARTGAEFKDEITTNGVVLNRRERFQMPTIDPARLWAGVGSFAERVPPREHTFYP